MTHRLLFLSITTGYCDIEKKYFYCFPQPYILILFLTQRESPISIQQSKHTLEELASLAQTGDQMAYRLFLQKLTPYIRGAMRKKLGTIVDQEDITQECLLAIHKNLASYHPSQPVKPWVSAIIRYKLADHFRRLSRKKEQLSITADLDVTEAPNPTNDYDEASEKDAAEILGRLPQKLRSAIELTHINGLSYSEAAEKEGVTEVALRKRISRGFSKIRAVVAKEMEI